MDVMEAIYQRRSVRAYTEQPVDKAAVEVLIKAAIQAPDMDERVKSLFLSWRRRCAVAGPSLERPGPGSQALYDGEST